MIQYESNTADIFNLISYEWKHSSTNELLYRDRVIFSVLAVLAA